MDEWDGKTERRQYNSLLEKKVDDIHKLLVGNGKVGLCGKVEIMWHAGLYIIIGLSGAIGVWMWGQLLN